MSDNIDLFGDDSGSKEYEEMMAKKKAEAEAAKAAKEAEKKPAKKKEILKSAVVLDVKPAESETDLEKLVIKVKEIQMPGLEWKTHNLVPVAYGIKKIQILLHVVDETTSVDDLAEKIQENEDVGSVEVVSFTKL